MRAFIISFLALLITSLGDCHAQMTPELISQFNENLKGAKAGISRNQYNVGLLYEHGVGVPTNADLAVFWYTKAAEQGDPIAQHNLAVLYEKGERIPQNKEKALFWYKKAAELGATSSQIQLGNIYVKGVLAPQDYVEAFAWFNVASVSSGVGPTPEEDSRIGRANRDEIAKFMTLEARMQGQARSRQIMETIRVRLGAPSTPKEPTSNSDTQEEDESQNAKLVESFNRAMTYAIKGDAEAQSYVGFFYATGRGVTQDNAKAVFWWQKSADQGHANSQLLLGNMYSKGQGVEKDISKAFFWWRKSAEQGDSSAQLRMGSCYVKGEGVEKDLVEGYAWLTLASASNGKYLSARDAVGKSMSPAALTKARARSQELQDIIEAQKAGDGK